jgi:serine/threonine protein kinase
MGDNLIGRVLKGRYEIQKPLDKAESPCVFEAYDKSGDCQVVVKVIGAKYARRLDAKIRSIAGLKHPCLLPIYDWGKETINGAQRLYLVMPLAQGGSLEDRLKKGRLSLNETERILKEICAALGYAHGQQVLHLDLKPSKILFDEQGHVLVADFGLADLIQKAPHSKANADMVAQDYASPEQSSGDPTGPFTDIYYLGNILHQMVTGKSLKQEKTTEGLSAHLEHSLPAGIRSVIECATRKDPYLRYHTIGDLVQDFTAVIAQDEKDRRQMRLDVGALIIAIITCVVAVIKVSGFQPRLVLKRSTPTPAPTTASPTATWARTATRTLTPSPTLTLTPTPSPMPYGLVRVEQSHLHAGPGENYDELGIVRRGDQLPLCGCSEDGAWLQVDYLGMKGWVSVQAVKTSIEPTILPTVKVPLAPARPPTPTATPSLPGPNTAVRLQNPGFERVHDNLIPGWLWWAEDNFIDKKCSFDPCFDTPSFSQTNDPARVIDGPTLQVEATAFVGLKVYILQTASVSPTVPMRFQASAKAYSDLSGVRLAVGIEPNGSPDCSQARWGDTLLVDQSHGTVRLVTPTVAAGQAGRVTVCLYAESVYPARSNAAFFDNAILMANPE